VDGDGVPGEQRTDEAVGDEPCHVRARPRVDERRSRHPYRIAAAVALVDQQARHLRVVDRLLARHLARHELELALGILAEERVAVHVDPLASILRVPDGDQVALVHAPALTHPERAIGIGNERRIHPRLARHPPVAGNADVGRQVRRREKPLGENSIGRSRDEPGVGSTRELGGAEIRVGETAHESKMTAGDVVLKLATGSSRGARSSLERP
jgi:hypothetical protein